MFRECSSGVGTPDLGEMKGRRPTCVGQKTPYQAFESTISGSSKTHFLYMQPSFGPNLNTSPFDSPKLRSFDTNLNTSWTIWNVKRHEFLRDFKDSSNVVSLSEINTNDWLAWHIINPANLGNIFKLFPARSPSGVYYVHVSWDIRIRAIRSWHQFGAIKKHFRHKTLRQMAKSKIPFMDQWMKLVLKSTKPKGLWDWEYIKLVLKELIP